MAQPYETELSALRNLVLQARDNLTGIELPQGRAKRAKELLDAAVALADDLLTVKPAAALGAKGGNKTAERGPEYFAKIAAMRKTKAGGRPPKAASPDSGKPGR
jgi:hypothetical protein